jgi:pantetheine-phosphate adenylyltransferase
VPLTAVCPGSFDPVTLGHLDIIERAAARVDHVLVAVLENASKRGLFTVDERVAMLAAETAHLDNVAVDRFEGLLVDLCRARDIGIVVKGLRAGGDVDYELQMAQMNRHMAGVETAFLATDPRYAHVSSSLVKEIARWEGPLDGLVPPAVAEALRQRARTVPTGDGR